MLGLRALLPAARHVGARSLPLPAAAVQGPAAVGTVAPQQPARQQQHRGMAIQPMADITDNPRLEAWVTSLETQERVGLMPLSKPVFGLPPRTDILRQVVTYQRARWRGTSTAATKTRGEVRGGGKKPWPQKGTGRARHGSRRSPIFVGGMCCAASAIGQPSACHPRWCCAYGCGWTPLRPFASSCVKLRGW